MANLKFDLREALGMLLCALLSLAAFLALLLLLAYSDGNRLVAALGLLVSLACPVMWLLFLLWRDGGGGGLVQWVKRKAALPRLWPLLRREKQPDGVPAG